MLDKVYGNENCWYMLVDTSRSKTVCAAIGVFVKFFDFYDESIIDELFQD